MAVGACIPVIRVQANPPLDLPLRIPPLSFERGSRAFSGPRGNFAVDVRQQGDLRSPPDLHIYRPLHTISLLLTVASLSIQ